jgi:small subunit ribosomal protein S6
MTQIDTHSYELVYVVRPDLGDEGISALNDRLKNIVTAQGGVIQGTELWGKRNLAYRIGKNSEGFYVLHRYAMLPKGSEEVDRLLRYNEDVLRYLVIRTDE